MRVKLVEPPELGWRVVSHLQVTGRRNKGGATASPGKQWQQREQWTQTVERCTLQIEEVRLLSRI